MSFDVSYTSLSSYPPSTETLRSEFVEAVRCMELRPMMSKSARKRAFEETSDWLAGHENLEEKNKRRHTFKQQLRDDLGAYRLGGDTAALTTLLQRLPRLTKITINADPPYQEESLTFESSASEDLYTTASIALPAIGWSGIELESLECGPQIYSAGHSGKPSMHANVLGLPLKTLTNFASLRVLRLFLNADEMTWGDNRHGLQCTSRFLQHAPNLTDLHLCFSNFKHTTTIFEHIASSNTCPNLSSLSLEGFDMHEHSLVQFLSGRETRLQHILLANNMIRSGSWPTIFLQLSTFEHLTSFTVNQLSHEGKRVAFPNFGYASVLWRPNNDLPAGDWELVIGPEYIVELEGEIDRLDERLKELAGCCKVQRIGVQPDLEDESMLIWTYTP
ncbi:MAG: hypothetical protein M1820_000638 [Bogoriella megaspora]|nr:MAG: hypothetical protein M1820_000638 [Bogoriella megaspora]